MSEVSRILIAVLVVGNALALLAGLALLMIPERVVKVLGMRSKHPVSVRNLTKKAEQIRDTEKILMRYPRILGGAMLAGGLFVLVKWVHFVQANSVTEGGRTLAQLFSHTMLAPPVWESLWIVLLVVVFIGAALAIVVGLLAFTSVTQLKKISKFANQWVSTRKAAKPAAQPYYGLDRLVAAHPQAWGVIIVVLALYTLGMIAWFSRLIA